jgi:hypothetical protein
MTAEAYTDRTKTETRRFWKARHAALFLPGRMFDGLNKDFRAGGHRLHSSCVVFCRQERLGDMTEDSFLREGGTRYWANREAYIEMMGGPDLCPWVLRFEHLFEGYSVGCEYCAMCEGAKAAGWCKRGAGMDFMKCGTTQQVNKDADHV